MRQKLKVTFTSSTRSGPFEINEWEDINTLVMKANILNDLEDHEAEAFEYWDYSEYQNDDVSFTSAMANR